MSDKIRIDDIGITCIVGIFPEERVKPQPLRLSVEIDLDVQAAATSCRLEESLDYARLADEMIFILEAGRFRLLESAGLALCHYLLQPSEGGQQADAAKVTILKPEALHGRGVPSLVVERTRKTLAVAGGTPKDVLFQCPDALIERVQRGSPAPRDKPGYAQHRDLETAGAWTLRVWTPKG